jgi:hypothetical protein
MIHQYLRSRYPTGKSKRNNLEVKIHISLEEFMFNTHECYGSKISTFILRFCERVKLSLFSIFQGKRREDVKASARWNNKPAAPNLSLVPSKSVTNDGEQIVIRS